MPIINKSLKQYYRQYLQLHQDPRCRRLHVAGNVVTLLYMYICVANFWWVPLCAAPLVVYPFAWTGHLLFEKNKPAAWASPVRAKLCDWWMTWDILRGQIKW